MFTGDLCCLEGLALRDLELDLGLAAPTIELELLSLDKFRFFLAGVLMLLSLEFINFLFGLGFDSKEGDTSPVSDLDRLNLGRIQLSLDALLPTFDKDVSSCLKFAGVWLCC